MVPHHMSGEEWDELRDALKKGELHAIDLVNAVMNAIKDDEETPLKETAEWLAEKVEDDGIWEDDLFKAVSIMSNWFSHEIPIDKLPVKENWAYCLLVEAYGEIWRHKDGSGIKIRPKKNK